jgi:hypothetical protein
MEMATLRPATLPRLPLVRSLFRPSGPPAAEAHLHFDRNARVWLTHETRDVRGVHDAHQALTHLQECA